MEEKIKTPQTPQTQSFSFYLISLCVCGVSALKTALSSIQIKSVLNSRSADLTTTDHRPLTTDHYD
jgi:hypothetical protein